MRVAIAVTLLTVLFGGASRASDVASVTVIEESLATTEDSLAIGYAIVQFEMPALSDGAKLLEAILTLYMDVATVLPEEVSDGLATIEVALMPALVAGKLDVSAIQTVAQTTTKVGANRTIRLHITDILLGAIEENESPVTLLVGSITGKRYGRFATKEVPNAAFEAKAVLTLHTQTAYQDGAIGVAE